MSKLVEKLNKASRSVTTPMGFHSTMTGKDDSSLVLIAAIASDAIDSKTLTSIPIDAALILDPKVTVTKTKKIIKLLGDIPLGLATDKLSAKDTVEYSGINLDFIAFNKKTPLTSMQVSTTGKFLIIDSTLDIDLARSLNSIDVNGVIIDNSGIDMLTIEHLLICKRYHEILRKPLLMILSSVITDYELQQLWETGISGVVLTSDWSPGSLEKVRHVVDSLPKKHAHRTDKAEAILPRYNVDIDESSDEEEEEEE